MVTHRRPLKIAPNMVPMLVSLANSVPSPYRPPTKWETLDDVPRLPLETPHPSNADGTCRVVTARNSQ